MTGLFTSLLDTLERANASSSDPILFQKFARSLGKSKLSTSQYVDVDYLYRLAPELRDRGWMIFNLGSPSGARETQFALAKGPKAVTDFFLQDEDVWKGVKTEAFASKASSKDLEPFRMIPRLSELSLVSLAVVSGALHRALGIQMTSSAVTPARGHGVYSFDVRPTRKGERIWTHTDGQVEFDALITGKRRSRPCVFVIVAKRHREHRSLSKVRLAYPALALRSVLPAKTDVIPVFLAARWTRKQDGAGALTFNVAECGFRDTRKVPGLDSLNVIQARRLRLEAW